MKDNEKVAARARLVLEIADTRYNRETQTHEDVSNLPKRISDIFEKMGIECEWTECCECGCLVRTEPTSYFWTPSYAILNECEVYCKECLEKDPEDYLQRLEGYTTTAVTIDINPSKHGYVKVNEDSYETGFHIGQNDSPATVAKNLEKKGINKYLFRIDEVGQFDTKWSVYVHESEADLLHDDDESDDDV